MNEQKTERAEASLARVLGFFNRAENKASFLFALDTAMVAVVALNLQPADLAVWYINVLAVVTGLLLLGSLFFLYRSAFPSLDGGAGSLIYFREIAAKTEANFIEACEKRGDEEYRRDVLGQVWRNSEILKIKFDAVKYAFVLTALALIPWAGFLIATAVIHAQVPVIR